MDNVACYGSEDKLINCSYHTDTTEDNHINDIWIECNMTDTSTVITLPNVSDKSNNGSSIAPLALSLIALGISILVMVFMIDYIVYRHKRNSRTDGR